MRRRTIALLALAGCAGIVTTVLLLPRPPHTIPEIIERWSRQPAMQPKLLERLAETAPDRLLDALAPLLDAPDPRMRRAATEATYWWMFRNARSATEPLRESVLAIERALVRRLRDPDLDVRLGAAGALAATWTHMAPPIGDEAVLAALLDLLAEPDDDARFISASLIGYSLWSPDRVESELREAFRAGGRVARQGIAHAFTFIEAQDPETIALLAQTLREESQAEGHESESLRRFIVNALGAAGAVSVPSYRLLLERLRDDDETESIVEAAARALGDLPLGNAAAEEVLAELLMRRARFDMSFDAGTWIQSVARTAARIPDSPLTDGALSAIDELWSEPLELQCAAGLARIAAARHDVPLAHRVRAPLLEWLEHTLTWCDLYPSFVCDPPGVTESAVLLASWPAARFPDEPIRRILDGAAAADVPWLRRWASRERAKLG